MRALVLSGGGSYGAYQVGVLKRLAEKGHTWDVMAGVSVGSLNSTLMAMHTPDMQLNGAYKAELFWKEIQGNKSVYKPRAFGILSGLFNPSLNTTEPLERLVRSSLDFKALRSSGVKLFIGATDLQSGLYAHGTEKDDNLLDWIMASCAMPLLFPPRKINGRGAWVDGGVRNVTPLLDVLVETGVTEVDVVICGTLGQPLVTSESPFGTILDVGKRAIEILADEVLQTDLPQALEKAKQKVALHLYHPHQHFTHDAFDFDPKKIRELIDQGYTDTDLSLTSQALLDRTWH